MILTQMKYLFTVLATLTLGFAITGCANKKDHANIPGIDGDYVLGTPLADRTEGSSFLSNKVIKGKFQPIYFGFDSFAVSDSEMMKLGQVADGLHGMKNDVIIAGFTDDRGTEEYNRGLGERRALAVRQALIGLGINGSRIQTVSFGKELPADPGSGEEAWAKNRRAEFGIIK